MQGRNRHGTGDAYRHLLFPLSARKRQTVAVRVWCLSFFGGFPEDLFIHGPIADGNYPQRLFWGLSRVAVLLGSPCDHNLTRHRSRGIVCVRVARGSRFKFPFPGIGTHMLPKRGVHEEYTLHCLSSTRLPWTWATWDIWYLVALLASVLADYNFVRGNIPDLGDRL